VPPQLSTKHVQFSPLFVDLSLSLPLPLPLLLLSLLLQSGHVVVGETAVVGYFQQHPPPVPDNLRLIEYIRWVGEGW
jgi:hypothetical protein